MKWRGVKLSLLTSRLCLLDQQLFALLRSKDSIFRDAHGFVVLEGPFGISQYVNPATGEMPFGTCTPEDLVKLWKVNPDRWDLWAYELPNIWGLFDKDTTLFHFIRLTALWLGKQSEEASISAGVLKAEWFNYAPQLSEYWGWVCPVRNRVVNKTPTRNRLPSDLSEFSQMSEMENINQSLSDLLRDFVEDK